MGFVAIALCACGPEPRAVPPPPPKPSATASAEAAPPEVPLRVEMRGARRDPVTAVALSQDGAVLAAVVGGGSVELWRVLDGKLTATYRLQERARSVRFASDGKVLVTDREALRVDDGEPAEAPPLPAAPAPVVAPMSERVLAWTSLADDRVRRLETWAKKRGGAVMTDGGLVRLQQANKEGSPEVHASPDGLLVWDDAWSFLRLDTGTAWSLPPWSKGLSDTGGETGARLELSFGPTPDRVVVLSIASTSDVCEKGEAKLVDTRAGKVVADLAPACAPHDVDWSPHGRYVSRPTLWHESIAIAEAQSGKVVLEHLDDAAPAWSDDERVLAARDAGNVTVIDLDKRTPPLVVPGSGRPGSIDLTFTKDGRALLDLRPDGLDVWDLAAGTRAAQLPLRAAGEGFLRFDPEERTVAITTDGGIALVDVAERRVRATIEGLRLTAFARDLSAVLRAGKGVVEIVPADPAAARVTVKLPPAFAKRPMEELAWRADKASFAAAFDRGEVDVFDTSTGRLLTKVVPPGAAGASVAALAFQPKGTLLAIVELGAGGGERLEIVDLESGARHVIKRDEDNFRHLAFTRDGARLVVFGETSTMGRPDPWIEIVDVKAMQGVGRLPITTTTTNLPSTAERVAARTTGAVDPSMWLWPEAAAIAEDNAVALSLDGAVAAISDKERVRLLRRSDGAALAMYAYTFARDEVQAVADDHGAFDAPESAWPFVVLAGGAAPITDRGEIAKHLRRGLLAAFLAGEKR